MMRLVSASFWRQPGMHPVRASLGGLIGLIVSAWVTAQLLPAGSTLPYLVAPLGASAVLVFALPAAPLAQPRAVIGGNMLSALCGALVARLIPDPMLAGPAAAGTAILAMHLARCLHPPGGAVALLCVFGGEAVRASGLSFALFPVGLGSAILVAVGMLINNLGGSRYPHRPEISPPSAATDDTAAVDRSGFDRRDVETALNRMEDRPDIAVEDLYVLLRAVEAAAFARKRPAPSCLDIMSRDVSSVKPNSFDSYN